MTTRVDDIAADVAWARPAQINAALILNYSGPAYAGLDQLKAWAQPFLIGYEGTTTRSYAGAGAGIADAQQLLTVVRTIPGYIEDRCGTWFCAADENSTPGWALPGITDYGDAFTTTLLQAGWHPTVELPYGNPAASGAGAAGVARAGGNPGRWGIGTWGEGEGGGPYQPPPSSDAWLVQSGNSPGPAAGTDLDWIYRDLADFGAYGGPNQGDDMAQADVDALRESADKVNAALFGDFPFGKNKGLIQEFHELKAFVDGGNVAYGGPTLVGEIAEKVAVPQIDIEQLATAIVAKLPPGTSIDPAALAAGIASHLQLTNK